MTRADAPAQAIAAIRAQRAAGQLLVDPRGSSPEEIAGHLLAVQAQDLQGARLALRARGARLPRLTSTMRLASSAPS